MIEIQYKVIVHFDIPKETQVKTVEKCIEALFQDTHGEPVEEVESSTYGPWIRAFASTMADAQRIEAKFKRTIKKFNGVIL